MNIGQIGDWQPPGNWQPRARLYVIAAATTALALVVGILEPRLPGATPDP